MDTRNHRLNRNERSVDDDSLDTLLDRVDEAARENPVSIGDIVEATGTGFFSPLLLFTGLIMLTPVVGEISVLMGMVVIVVAAIFSIGAIALIVNRFI